MKRLYRRNDVVFEVKNEYLKKKKKFKYKDRFYVFKNSTLREKLINKCYNDFFANHFNVAKTHKLFVYKYYKMKT